MEEIVGADLHLSDLNNKMNEERFADLRVCVESFKEKLPNQQLFLRMTVLCLLLRGIFPQCG